MRAIALGVRFLLELTMIGSMVYGGVALVGGWAGWLVGIAAAAGAVAVWGKWIAQNIKDPIAVPVRFAIELTLFVLGFGGIALAGHPVVAGALAAVYAADWGALLATGKAYQV